MKIKKIICNEDFNLNSDKKNDIQIIIKKLKVPALCPDKSEKNIEVKIKIVAKNLNFIFENKIIKLMQKNINPILWINGPFNGFLKGQVNCRLSVKIISAPINKKIKINEKKLTNNAKYRICFSFINHP